MRRRTFFRSVGAASAAPFILPSNVWSATVKPNDRITMGFIGMGMQSHALLRTFLYGTQVLAVCDPDTTRRENAAKVANDFYREYPEKGSPDCKAYSDFRELIARDDIDAVCIATPDHWHAIPMLAALNSGKDVYCEKPLTHTIAEAVAVMRTAKHNKRIVQTGSMQRSSKEFRIACELVRNGAIGKVDRAVCSFGGAPSPCNLPEEAMEPGLDWNMWLGPAPMRPYNSILSPRGVMKRYPHWRKYEEYGGGGICDWGAHHLDIAQWAFDRDTSGPVEVRPPEKQDSQDGAAMVYSDGVTVLQKKGFGVHFFGTEGEVKVNRNKFEFIHQGKTVAKFTRREDGGSLASHLQTAERSFLNNAGVKLYESKNHLSNFLDCVRSRKQPITNEETGGRTAICCHLMNLAYKHRQTIKWNPDSLTFLEGGGNPEWLNKDYRGPWKLS